VSNLHRILVVRAEPLREGQVQKLRADFLEPPAVATPTAASVMLAAEELHCMVSVSRVASETMAPDQLQPHPPPPTPRPPAAASRVK
jgi:hypothetical protein